MAEGGLISASDHFRQQLEKGYRLTTAEILYRLPDHPKILQSFIWQDLDKIPGFPVLRRFLTFWEKELDGKLYRVRIAAVDRVSTSKWGYVGEEISLQ
jgi:uncharacterized protein Usg